MSLKSRTWDRMYRKGDPSWERGGPDPGLTSALDARELRGPGQALDLGCGTGDNAIALAQRGFEVTALDIGEVPLTRARAKAAAAAIPVRFLRADVTRLDGTEGITGPFDLVVDCGLLMSVPGERGRRAYTAALERLTSVGSQVYQHQWELPEPPSGPSARALLARWGAVVLSPGELEGRLGTAFSVELLDRVVTSVDDPGMRRLGLREVAVATYWLTRRP
jgi:SAM-dependent methyltransferase